MRGFMMKLWAVIALSTLAISSYAQHHEDHNGPHQEHEEGGVKQEIKAEIQHHLKDAHSFHILTDKTTGEHYGFPLPVILYDNGLHVFMSSAFHHGEDVVESNGQHYALHHNHIYKTDAQGTIHHDEEGNITNEHPLDLSITKNVFVSIVTSLILLLIFGGMAKTYRNSALPKGIGRVFEPIVIFVRDEIARPNIGEKHYKKYMGFLLSIFFFIWFVNMFGLTPLGINLTGSIAVTCSLALFTFVITQISGNGNYWKHIFWMPGVPVPMKILLAPIELLGVFIKPFALMIRLYANISAGHVVMMSLIGLLFIFHNWFARGAFLGLTVFLSIIEFFVALLQAYIFTMLSALYFGLAKEEHEHAH